MQPIFLILGTPACGKSTVSRALLQRFERGLHLPVDDLRHMVVSGLVDMSFEVSDALRLQVRLAREAASDVAERYAHAGFAVAIDDFWIPGGFGLSDDPDGFYALNNAHRVALLPSLETTLERLYSRNPDEGAYKEMLERAVRASHALIASHPKNGWQVVDSSHLSVEQTVDRILSLTRTAGIPSKPRELP